MPYILGQEEIQSEAGHPLTRGKSHLCHAYAPALCCLHSSGQGSGVTGDLSFRVPHSRKGAEGAQNLAVLDTANPDAVERPWSPRSASFDPDPALPVLSLVFCKVLPEPQVPLVQLG